MGEGESGVSHCGHLRFPFSFQKTFLVFCEFRLWFALLRFRGFLVFCMSDSMLMMLAMPAARKVCIHSFFVVSWFDLQLVQTWTPEIQFCKTFLGIFFVLFSSHQGSVFSSGFQEFGFSSSRRQRSCTYTLRAVVAKGNIPCPPQSSKDCSARIWAHSCSS